MCKCEGLPVCMCTIYMQEPLEDRRGVGSSKTGAIDSCVLPYGCWGPNPGPVQKQQVLVTAEPSFKPLIKKITIFFLKKIIESKPVWWIRPGARRITCLWSSLATYIAKPRLA